MSKESRAKAEGFITKIREAQKGGVNLVLIKSKNKGPYVEHLQNFHLPKIDENGVIAYRYKKENCCTYIDPTKITSTCPIGKSIL